MANEPRQSPGTLEKMQSKVVSEAARKEFNKLDSASDKQVVELKQQIQCLTNTVN